MAMKFKQYTTSCNTPLGGEKEKDRNKYHNVQYAQTFTVRIYRKSGK